MPYSLSRVNGEYCVILDDTGKPVPGGCHGPDRASALRHLTALASATSDHKALESLTRQEMVVARYTVAGLCNKEIAHVLVLKEGTVKAHQQNIRRKLQVDNRSGMTIKMLMLGLIRLQELPELVVMADKARRSNN